MVNLNKLLKKKSEENRKQERDKTLPKIVEHTELNQVLDIELQYIHENKGQPRKEYDETKLKELADSIEHKGLIQPIVVSEQGNRFFIIIAGHRRFRAYKLLGKTSIPCVVDIFSTNQDDLSEKALVENLQRENLSIYEIAETLTKLNKDQNFNVSKIEKITSYKKTQIYDYIKCFNAIKDEKITKDQLLKLGHKNCIKILTKNNFPAAGIQENIDFHELKIAKKNSKSFQKIVIKDTEKLEELQNAQKTLENQLIVVRRLIKKVKKGQE